MSTQLYVSDSRDGRDFYIKSTSDRGHSLWLCIEGMQLHWDLPEGAKKIWVELSTGSSRPHPDAVRFEPSGVSQLYLRPWAGIKVESDSCGRRFIYHGTYTLFAEQLRRAAGSKNKVWMRLWYSEEKS